MEPKRVLLAVGPAVEPALRAFLAEVLADGFEVVGAVEVLDDLPARLAELRPNLVVVSRHLPGSVPAREVLLPARRAWPGAKVVLLAGPEDDEGRALVAAAIACGVYNFVYADRAGGVEREALRDAILADRTWADVAGHQPTLVVPESAASVGRAEAESQAPRTLKLSLPALPVPKLPKIEIGLPGRTTVGWSGPRPALGLVVAVWGASGGVGRTTTAANLAAAWAREGLRVSALDLCFGAPALADALGVRGYAAGRWDALRRGDPPAAILVQGGVEGVRVLPGPSLSEREQAPAMPADVVGRLVHQLRLEDDCIVLDLPADPLDEYARMGLGLAGLVVFVTDAAPGSVKRLGLVLQNPSVGTEAARALVVTRLRPDLGRDVQAVARELRVSPHLALGDNAGLYWPALNGAPVALAESAEGALWRRFGQSLIQSLKGAVQVGHR